jgi:hypothetical protein
MSGETLVNCVVTVDLVVVALFVSSNRTVKNAVKKNHASKVIPGLSEPD